jgi:hypothetical protein
MIHVRVIASVWILFGAVGAIAISVEGIRLLSRRADFDGGAVASLVIALPFCLLVVATAFALLRARRWAAVCIRVVSVLLFLYCLSFVFMSHFSFAWVGLLGAAFAVYTIVAAGKLKGET